MNTVVVDAIKSLMAEVGELTWRVHFQRASINQVIALAQKIYPEEWSCDDDNHLVPDEQFLALCVLVTAVKEMAV